MPRKVTSERSEFISDRQPCHALERFVIGGRTRAQSEQPFLEVSVPCISFPFSASEQAQAREGRLLPDPGARAKSGEVGANPNR